MRQLDVVYRPEAVNDLLDVFEIVLRISESPQTARRYVQRLRDRCRRIGHAPHAGTPRDDLVPGLRTVAFERRAVIAYRVVDEAVEITNLFYGGRDFDALYRDHPPESDDR